MSRRSPTRVSGRLQVHRDGYAFLIAERPVPGMEGDVFIPERALGSAMNGDRATVALTRFGRDGRAEGRVVKVLSRAHPTIVGTFRVMRHHFYVEPSDARVRTWIRIPAELALPPDDLQQDRIGATLPDYSQPEDLDGLIVNAEILEFAERGEQPTGRVIEVLGRPDDFGVDVEIVIRKHHIPHRFPGEALEQARKIPAVIRRQDLGGRRDFRGYDTVTIDGATARDFDDAVWVNRLESGNFALHVHIADVSHYVSPGSPIGREAEIRGNSVYFPDRAVPMLPLELSTGICSLNPQVDRLTMSVVLEINHRGQIVSQEITRGVIRSAERMTYADVHLILDGDDAVRERYAPLVERFEMMRELALILNRLRTRRGSIDFDLPEPLIEFDEFGEMVSIGRSSRNFAHRIIEEFMLIANETVATHIEEAGFESIYRIHEPPDPKRVLDFEEIAAVFGVSLGVRGLQARHSTQTGRGRGDESPPQLIDITPRHYQKLIKKVEGRPEERILTYLMLRSLKQARYSENNRGHFALASPTYTHFTSPIRRYPDLIVHRVLGTLLDHQPAGLHPAKLQKLAAHCSETERRAEDAERELVEWKKINFMASRLGDEFPALVVNTTPFGFFVELEDLFIEGLVALDTLPGGLWSYNEATRKIVANRSRRTFAIGDRVTVCLDRVDPVERKLGFSVVFPERKKT